MVGLVVLEWRVPFVLLSVRLAVVAVAASVVVSAVL